MIEEHCSVETLLDLILRELPEDEAFEVREHLITCDRCRTRMQELLDEPDGPPPGETPVGDREVEDAWRRFSERRGVRLPAEPRSTPREPDVDDSEARTSSPPDRKSSGRGPSARRLSGASSLALAAGLALAAVGLWNLVGPTQRPGPHEPAPMLASGARTLAEKGSPTRGSRPDRPTPVTCAGPGQLMIWTLEVPRLVGLEDPAVSKIELWRGDLLVGELSSVPAENGLLRLIVPPELTPDGFYVVKVFIPDEETTEDFYFNVRCGA